MDKFRPAASRIGYAPEFALLWSSQILAACLAGCMLGAIRIDLVIAVIVAIFCLAMFGHNLHILLGVSSSRKPEDFSVNLKALAIVYAIAILALGAYIIYFRPYASIGIGAGIATVICYTLIHKEELWAIGWVIAMPTACYVACGTLTLQFAVILAAIALLSGIGIYAYRALTGDYDNLPRTPVLKKVVALYNIAFATLAIGFIL